jgi:methylmalonyl-CoA mutase C-terminal domain/subunit
MQRRIRVLVGKPGLDGHDRGAKVVAAALRDAGMEVIYTGLHQTPEQIVEAAVQEDVDVVALSILSGAHMTLFPAVLSLMQERGIGDRLLSGGGIIPPEDMAALAERGVGRLFGPGSSTEDIVVYIREWFAKRHGPDALAPLPERPAPAAALPHPTADEVRHHLAPRRAAARAKAPAARAASAKAAARGAAERAAPRGAAARAAPRRAAERAAPRKAAKRATPRRAAARAARAPTRAARKKR